MGDMTRDQLVAELLFQLRNRTDTGTTGGANADRLALWTNWSYRHVCHPSVVYHWELEFRSNLTLVSGTNEYTFTPLAGRRVTGLLSVTHIDATVFSATARRVKLKPRDVRWFDERTISTGPPHIYAVFGNNLIIEGVPGANENNELLQVRGIVEPVALTASAVTVLDAVWDEVIVLGARWRALRDLDMPDKAEVAKQEFAALINEYENKDAFHAMEWDWQSDIRSEEYQ